MGLVVSRPPSFRAARVTVLRGLVRRDSNPPSADRLVSPRNRFVSLTHARIAHVRVPARLHTHPASRRGKLGASVRHARAGHSSRARKPRGDTAQSGSESKPTSQSLQIKMNVPTA